MIAKGVHVAIGTDNLALADGEDILAEARLAQVLQSPPGIADEQIGAVKALQWATVAGARVLGIKGLGSLELGCPADLVMLHTRSIDRAVFDLGHDVAASVLHWLRQHDIDQVLVGGQILVRDGRYIFRDRDEVERKAVEASQQWAMTPAIQLLRSQVQKRYASQDLSGQPYYWLNATN
jgi:5-methylthioadenosine/S-adenosylhomocysteine deaminase